jgi:hypothetical protein
MQKNFPSSFFLLKVIPLLTIIWTMFIISKWSLIQQHMFICQWHNMWNNLNINQFWPKDNNDMMQCVTYNKSFLFTSRLKALELQKKTNKYLYGTKESFQMFLKWKTPIHSYMNWGMNNIGIQFELN